MINYVNANGDLVSVTDAEVKEAIINFYGLRKFRVSVECDKTNGSLYHIYIFKSFLKTKEVEKLFLDSYELTFDEDVSEFVFIIEFTKVLKILKNKNS